MSARSSTAKPMRGMRNEDSLLFTVKDLAAARTAAPAEAKDGHSHAGSGLLDLDALTRSYFEARNENAVLGLGTELPEAIVVAAWQPARPAGPSIIAIAFAAITGVASAALILMATWMWLVPHAVGASAPGRQAAAPASTPRAPEPPAPQQPAVAVTAPAAAQDEPAEATDAISEATDPVSTVPAATPAPAAPAEQAQIAKPAASATQRPTSTAATSRPRPRPATEQSSAQAPAAECMDEVACLLASNPPACCTRAPSSQTGQAQAASPREEDTALPDKLDRAAIQAGMAKVRGSVAACERHGTGTVSLSVRVDGDGRVSAVDVKSAPSQALGACAAQAVEDARFARSRSGQRFVYPFVF